MKYKLVVCKKKGGSKLNTLEKDVNELLKQGYKPKGGVSVSKSNGLEIWTQALIKLKKNEH